RTLFVSLGSTATPRPVGFDGQFEAMPAVSGPEESAGSMFGPPAADGGGGPGRNMEYRAAEILDPDAGPPMALWARLRGGRPLTRAGIAFVADMVPPGIARAAGMMGGGPSLDNSLRFGRLDVEPEWVLLELRGHMAYGAHGHGSVRVWSQEGDLLAVGGQSANMFHMMRADEAGDLNAMRRRS
ncbi:MAG TPA: hypothetical protein VFH45_10685, partial [Acidimicrobiales bacterium]|nr:hypothetical protein [Acidimicrobiales bacterium]